MPDLAALSLLPPGCIEGAFWQRFNLTKWMDTHTVYRRHGAGALVPEEPLIHSAAQVDRLPSPRSFSFPLLRWSVGCFEDVNIAIITAI